MTATVPGTGTPERSRSRAHSHLSSVVACQVKSQHCRAIGQCSDSPRNRLRSSSVRAGSYTPYWTYSGKVSLPRPRWSLRYSRAIETGLRPLVRAAWRRYSADGRASGSCQSSSRSRTLRTDVEDPPFAAGLAVP